MNISQSTFYFRLLLVLPVILIVLIFTYYPSLISFYYSFTNWDGITKPTFIGLENFRNLLVDKSMLKATGNSFLVALSYLTIGNLIALPLALILNKPLKSRGFLRTSFYLPAVVSLVVVSMTWGSILEYNGVLNSLMQHLGFDQWTYDWLGKQNTVLGSLIFISMWQGTGWAAVIYLAGLQSIPHELYEAGRIDGANSTQNFRHITFPLLMPTITIKMFIDLTSGLRFFDLPYIMTNGGPGDASATLSYKIVRMAFDGSKGYATAAGFLFLVMISIIVSIQLYFTRRREVEL